MTMTLNLEVAQGVRLQDIKEALVGVEYSDLSETESELSVVLPNTNASMSVKTNLEDSTVLTEVKTWRVQTGLLDYEHILTLMLRCLTHLMM